MDKVVFFKVIPYFIQDIYNFKSMISALLIDSILLFYIIEPDGQVL